MFWQSIIGGLMVLGNTKVLIGLGAYMFIAALMLLFIVWSEPKPTIYHLEQQRIREEKFGEPMPRMPTFLQSMMLSAADSIALGFMIAWLLPILLGFSWTIPSELLFQQSWNILTCSAIAATAFFGIAYLMPAFIPFVGRIVLMSPALGVFIPGVIILHLVLPLFYKFPSSRHTLLLSPGILATVAYLIIAAVIVRGVGLLIFLFFKVSESRGGTPVDLRLAPKVIVPLLTKVSGIIPLFMYAHYMGLFLKK